MKRFTSILIFIIELLFLILVLALVIFAVYAGKHPVIDSPELVGYLTM